MFSNVLNEDNINAVYSNLIEATESVAKEMLPLKPRGKANIVKDCASVNSARESLKEISLDYHRSPTKPKKKALELAKKRLDEAYLKAEADFIDGKINDISSLHINKKHHAAWKTIGELSGKNSKPTTSIKGDQAIKECLVGMIILKIFLGKHLLRQEMTCCLWIRSQTLLIYLPLILPLVN